MEYKTETIMTIKFTDGKKKKTEAFNSLHHMKNKPSLKNNHTITNPKH